MRSELLVAVLVVAGCRAEPTQALVTIRSVLTPAEMDTVDVTVAGAVTPDETFTFDNDGLGRDGWSFGIEPRANTSLERQVVVRAAGRLRMGIVATGTATIERFVENETVNVDLLLGPAPDGRVDGGVSPLADGGVDDGGVVDAGVDLGDGGVGLDGGASVMPWLEQITGLEAGAIVGVATGPSGQIAVAGIAAGPVDYDNTTITTSDRDSFVLMISPVGRLVWATRFEGGGDQILTSITFSDDGSIWVTGWATTTLRISPNKGPVGADQFIVGRQAVLQQLQPDGKPGAGLIFSGPRESEANAVVVTPSRIVVTGSGEGPIVASTCTGEPPVPTQVDKDVFVAAFQRGTNPPQCSWLEMLGGDGADVGLALAHAPVDGSVVVTGRYVGRFETSEGPLLPNQVTPEGFLLRMGLSTGDVAASERFGGEDLDEGRALLVLSAPDQIVVAGRFDSNLVTLGSTMVSTRNEPMVLGFTVDLQSLVLREVIDAERTGQGGGQTVINGLSRTNDGRIVLGGSFSSPLAFDAPNGMIAPNGQNDILLASYELGVGVDFVHATGSNRLDFLSGVALQAASGFVVVAGRHSDTIVLPPNTTSAGTRMGVGFVATTIIP